MITISVFADEIAADLDVQMDTMARHGVRHIDVRGIDNINVSAMTIEQAKTYHSRLDARGIAVASLGSPIGKIRIDEPFAPHLELLRHTCDVARALGTRQIRVFSFYPPREQDIRDHRDAVMDRLVQMAQLAAREDVMLWCENERGIYGQTIEGGLDIFRTVRSPSMGCLFDPANYVYDAIDPLEAWNSGLGDLTGYFHIKDKHPDQPHCCAAGTGHGKIPQILADCKRRGWAGVMTIEPHMTKAAQFSGFAGPELTGQAIEALKGLLTQAGLGYQ